MNNYSSNHLSADNNYTNEDRHNYEFEGIDTDNNPEKIAISSEQTQFLDSAIYSLEPKYSIVYQLRDIEGLTNKEAAQALGISISAVKSRILRARNELKEKLSRTYPEYRS
ncbi:MAG: sigma-70 family RNA polymerase sigma factor [Candidatus Dadabacteria bacterium]|nr:sigma-70 family RNA polymerase sigma factor [Candidatus Dadabacteria bacterium]NIV41465.1 sigma-70 family RNA polymerase sigma factor [Candidatus Dadabacteria bacterium]NIX15661.1 sigma-70 family RNA polymerase sigma factor [Candidatus Dadabacteria bacterium]